METIILAAGQGRRLWPYGATWPKAALPLANRPLIGWLLEAAREAGAEHCTVVTGPLAGQVRAAVVDERAVDAVAASGAPGTATALVAGLDALGAETEAVLVLYGDIFVTGADLRRLVGALDDGAAAAVLVAGLDGEEPGAWIGAQVSEGRLERVEGHPRGGALRTAGAFVFRREALKYVRANPGCGVWPPVGGMPHLEADLEESLNQMLSRGLAVAAVTAQGPFVDVDKPWHLLVANQRAAAWRLSRHAESRLDGVEIHPDAEIEGRVVAEPGVRIGARVRIRGQVHIARGTVIDNGAMLSGTLDIGPDCLITDYCQVGGGAIGARCRILHCAEVSGLVMDGCHLSHYMEFYGILGRRCDLGAATVCGTLRFDDGRTEHRVAGRRERPPQHANASYLGDFTRTGVNATIMPGRKVGAYSVVGAGVVLDEDLPERTMRLLKQETVDIPWGSERYGW